MEWPGQALVLKTARGTDYGMVHNFLGAMENPFRAHKLWKDAADDEMCPAPPRPPPRARRRGWRCTGLRCRRAGPGEPEPVRPI